MIHEHTLHIGTPFAVIEVFGLQLTLVSSAPPSSPPGNHRTVQAIAISDEDWRRG